MCEGRRGTEGNRCPSIEGDYQYSEEEETVSKLLNVLFVGLLLAGIAAGCGPAPTPEKVIVKETVEVQVTPAVEKAAEAPAAATQQEWTLLNPEGVVIVEPLVTNAHPETLEGKTVVLKWSGKPNGDIFLDRIAELLVKDVKDVKVIKSWEVNPALKGWSAAKGKSVTLAKAIAELEPDLVIGAQGD